MIKLSERQLPFIHCIQPLDRTNNWFYRAGIARSLRRTGSPENVRLGVRFAHSMILYMW